MKKLVSFLISILLLSSFLSCKAPEHDRNETLTGELGIWKATVILPATGTEKEGRVRVLLELTSKDMAENIYQQNGTLVFTLGSPEGAWTVTYDRKKGFLTESRGKDDFLKYEDTKFDLTLFLSAEQIRNLKKDASMIHLEIQGASETKIELKHAS